MSIVRLGFHRGKRGRQCVISAPSFLPSCNRGAALCNNCRLGGGLLQGEAGATGTGGPAARLVRL